MGIRGAERPSERSVSVPPEVRDGYFDLGDAPGLGIEADWGWANVIACRSRCPVPTACTPIYLFHAGNASDALLCLEEA